MNFRNRFLLSRFSDFSVDFPRLIFIWIFQIDFFRFDPWSIFRNDLFKFSKSIVGRFFTIDFWATFWNRFFKIDFLSVIRNRFFVNFFKWIFSRFFQNDQLQLSKWICSRFFRIDFESIFQNYSFKFWKSIFSRIAVYKRKERARFNYQYSSYIGEKISTSYTCRWCIAIMLEWLEKNSSLWNPLCGCGREEKFEYLPYSVIPSSPGRLYEANTVRKFSNIWTTQRRVESLRVFGYNYTVAAAAAVASSYSKYSIYRKASSIAFTRRVRGSVQWELETDVTTLLAWRD